jgi:RimJ/RimL family protein N-acetyltransferase
MPYTASTPRLYLEPLTLAHLSDFHELWNNDASVMWSTKPRKNSLEESRQFMIEFILPTKENWCVDKYAFLLKEDVGEEKGGRDGKGEGGDGEGSLKMIGFAGTNRWCEQGLEVGYCMNIKYWGRGFASEGFKKFLEVYWGLENRRDVNRLVAKTHPENRASQRVCVKCGGRRGEVLKGAYERYVDGGVKSDVWLFLFDRPGVVVEEGSDGRVEEEENKAEGA